MAGTGHGYTCHGLSVRLTRLFTTLTMFAPGEEMLHSIYTVTVQRWLEEFPTKVVHHHAEFARVRLRQNSAASAPCCIYSHFQELITFQMFASAQSHLKSHAQSPYILAKKKLNH